MITGLLEAPVRLLFWDDQTVQRGGEETRKNNGGSDGSQSPQPSLDFVLYCVMENIET